MDAQAVQLMIKYLKNWMSQLCIDFCNLQLATRDPWTQIRQMAVFDCSQCEKILFAACRSHAPVPSIFPPGCAVFIGGHQHRRIHSREEMSAAAPVPSIFPPLSIVRKELQMCTLLALMAGGRAARARRPRAYKKGTHLGSIPITIDV